MDGKTHCLILITVGFGAGIIITMLLTLAAHYYLSLDPELSGQVQATGQCAREVMMSFAAEIIITTTILALVAHQYFTDSGAVGQVRECDQRDRVNNSSDLDPCVLRFHLEKSCRNGLCMDKIYPCLTNKISTQGPYRVVGKLFVSERKDHFVSVRDLNGTMIRKYGSHGQERGKMTSPAGIALDDEGLTYVTSDHKLQKFSSDGSVITEVGGSKPGNKPGKIFNKPYSVAIRNDKVYVCDAENDRIQVFDLELHFLECIATNIKKPQDIAFDNEGTMYVTSKSKNRVYVFNESGNKVHQFGRRNSDGNGLNEPTGIHIYGNYALVSDEGVNGIMVYNFCDHVMLSYLCHSLQHYSTRVATAGSYANSSVVGRIARYSYQRSIHPTRGAGERSKSK